MKALIMVEIDPFLSPGEHDPKPENYTYALSVMNEVGIPVVFRENRDLILMPEKKEILFVQNENINYKRGWNACLEEIERNVREAEYR